MQAMTLALDAAGGQPEPTAWAESSSASSRGRAADRRGRARSTAPRSSIFPATSTRSTRSRSVEEARGPPRRGALARATRGRRDFRCRSSSRRSAISTRARGHRRARARQYALVDVDPSGCSSRTACAPTSRSRSSTSTTGSGSAHALALARRAHARAARASTATTSSRWALARNGRCAEALPYSRRALRLGTHDALEVLPPRDDRALPRTRAAARPWFVKARSAEPALLAPLEPARAGGTRVRRSSSCLAFARPRRSRGCDARTRSGTSRSTASAASSSPGDRVYVKYVLDLAEIPTFQERGRSRTSGSTGAYLDGAIARGLDLRSTAGGPPRSALDHALGFPPRRRAACGRSASRPSSAAARSRAGSDSLPRHELRQPASAGRRSSCGRDGAAHSVLGAVKSMSHELRAYPKDLLEQPARRHDCVARRRARYDGGDAPPSSDARARRCGAATACRQRLRER